MISGEKVSKGPLSSLEGVVVLSDVDIQCISPY